MSDKTLAAEKAGNWSEVLSIYEEALQDISMQESQDFRDADANPTTAAATSDDERGYLRCLLNMGHHQALITHISGLTAQFQVTLPTPITPLFPPADTSLSLSLSL